MQPNAKRLALSVALTYVTVAVGWILFSDWLLDKFVKNTDLIVFIDIIKDAVFAILTAGLLHYLLKRSLNRWTAESEQRQQAEAAQQESENRYRRLFEVETDAVMMVDLQTAQILDANPAAELLYGYTREELLRLKATDVSAEPEETSEAIAGAEKYIQLRLHRHKNGTTFPVEISCSEYIHAGRKIHVAAMRDITHRQLAQQAMQRSEAQLNFALKTSRIGAWDLDLHSHVATRTLIHDQIFGYETLLPLWTYEIFLEHVLPADRAEVDRRFREATAAVSDWNFECRIRRHDGAVRWIFAAGGHERNSEGKPVRVSGIVQDITERKQAEEALRASEERLRFVTENARVGLVVVNRERRYTFANATYAEILDLSSPDIIGQRVADVLDTLYEAQVRPRLDQAFAGERVNFELKKPLHGEDRFYTVTYEPIKADGVVSLVVVVIADISSRKQTEETLRESQALYHSLVTQLPVGIFQKDQQGRYILVNPEFCRLKKMQPEDFLGKTPTEFFNDESSQLGRWELANKHAASGEKHHRLIMQTGEYLEQDEEHLLPGGEKIFFHAVKFPVLNAAGTVIGTRGVLFNITERKLTEEKIARLATAVEQAAEAIAITDLAGTIEYVNPAFEKITGYSSAEAIGQNPRILKSGKQDAQFYPHLWDTLKRGEIWAGNFTNRRKDGTFFEEEATISPIRNAAGKVINYIAVKRDVTREVQLEAQYRQAQKMEAIGTLAGGIAHDFNNMLAAMFGYGYLLQQDTEGNPEAQENIKEILKAAGRAKDLVQQILTFSRQRDQKREVIRLDTVVKEATKFLRASLPANIQIEMNLAADAPAVLADPTQIYQVTMNLATNALHAMEGRTGRLTVRLESFLPDKNFLQVHPEIRLIEYTRLTIADTGIGMDARTLERIFEPFFTTKPVGKGTGLGLAVVHGIIQSHEGAIIVESKVGEGTTFNLYFPAQAAEATLTDAMTISAPRGHGEKVLLVDDEVALTTMFRRLLQRLNYQVTTCNSAREAVEIFRQNPAQFDVAITDLTMPEMNGLEVARQLVAIRASLPVVLASGYSAALKEEHLREAGVCELLEKPVSLHALAEVLQRALSKI